MRYLVKYTGERIQGSIDLPGSKSIANRLLMIRELAGSKATIEGLPDNEDTELMLKLLDKIRNEKDNTGKHVVELDCGNTGTVFRFLTSYLSLTPGNWLLSGSERMQERPVGALVDALQHLGAEITYMGKTSYPPLRIKGKTLAGGEVFIKNAESSQFISSLLMVSPLLKEGLTLHLEGKKVSEPYIEMTLALMQKCGIRIKRTSDEYSIPPQAYTFDHQNVEKDWSSASTWFETIALSEHGRLLLKGLKEESIQGDKELINIYKKLGVSSAFTNEGLEITKTNLLYDHFDFNLPGNPDLVPSLAAAIAGNNYKGTITGIEHLRYKESDRLSCLQQEFFNLGFKVEIKNNNLIFNKIKTQQEPPLETFSHKDHRIVMALAPLALKTKELIINDPLVVNKSYPEFWHNLQCIGFQIFEL